MSLSMENIIKGLKEVTRKIEEAILDWKNWTLVVRPKGKLVILNDQA